MSYNISFTVFRTMLEFQLHVYPCTDVAAMYNISSNARIQLHPASGPSHLLAQDDRNADHVFQSAAHVNAFT